jgi:hypothetical protein
MMDGVLLCLILRSHLLFVYSFLLFGTLATLLTDWRLLIGYSRVGLVEVGNERDNPCHDGNSGDGWAVDFLVVVGLSPFAMADGSGICCQSLVT